MTFCENPLSRSLLGAKRTCPFALHMSANDPKRTFLPQVQGSGCLPPVIYRSFVAPDVLRVRMRMISAHALTVLMLVGFRLSATWRRDGVRMLIRP
jgi:hypothetical protein